MRISRVFACPRKPSRMKLWRERTAFTTCGITVSSKPTMPGNKGSRFCSRQIRFSRSSSFTVRWGSLVARSLYVRSAPRVSGRPAEDFMKTLLLRMRLCASNGDCSNLLSSTIPGLIHVAREQPPELEFRRFWQRLQALGLNAYEARSYLVLVGHPRFKALELAARAHVPRQKIYEVLDSLVEKGFARVIQDRTKLFSAIEPDQALPAYLQRRAHTLEAELAEQAQTARAVVGDLMTAYAEGQGGSGTLDYLRIVNDPRQIAAQFRR